LSLISRHSLPPSSPGFTLIEILMALFIGAIIITIVNMAFFGSYRKMEIVNSQREAYQMVRIVMDRMIRDLSCAYVPSSGEPPRQMSDDELSQYRFVGASEKDEAVFLDSIHFTTTTDLGLPGNFGVTKEVAYYLKEMEDVKDRYILVRMEDQLPHLGVSKGGKEMEVAENVVSLKIVYLDNESKESDNWDLSERLGLPEQVHITITFDIEGEPVSFTGVAYLPLSKLPKLTRAQGGQP